jgi:hypothetical protein
MPLGQVFFDLRWELLCEAMDPSAFIYTLNALDGARLIAPKDASSEGIVPAAPASSSRATRRRSDVSQNGAGAWAEVIDPATISLQANARAGRDP